MSAVSSTAAESVHNKVVGDVEHVSESSPPIDEEEEGAEDEASGGNAMDSRKKKLEELRKRMVRIGLQLRYHCLDSTSTPNLFQRSSAQANRASVIEESAKAKMTAREAARLERQRKLAETLRQKADAEDRGEDVERQKNWEYTIEENDEWEKKLARKARRADFSFNGMLRFMLDFACGLTGVCR